MAGAGPGRYPPQRKLHAENLRFKEDATLEVMTTFRRPDTLESQVLRAEGSKLIRERVFNKILEAENEIQSKSARGQVDIVPANYSFSYLGTEACADRKCYRLGITPRRQEKYLIQGEIWVDAEDWGIVRVQGSPSKRPSFWTRKIQIDRRFKRIDGMWLNASLESISDILIAGRPTLNIEYSYEAVQTDGTMDRAQFGQSVYLSSHQIALNGRGNGGTQEATALVCNFKQPCTSLPGTLPSITGRRRRFELRSFSFIAVPKSARPPHVS